MDFLSLLTYFMKGYSSQILMQYIYQSSFCYHSRLPEQLFAIHKNNNCWNTLNSVLTCQSVVLIDINFDDPHFITEFRS